MNISETPLRRLRIVRACGLLLVAVVMGLLPFIIDLEAEGLLFSYGGAGFCMLLGLLNLWLARRTSPDVLVTEDPNHAPVPVQITYYRRLLWLSIFIFPVVSVWVASDLRQLESGAKASLQHYAILMILYEHLGYWPTVLSLPLLGVVCCVFYILKIRKLTVLRTSGNA